MPEGIGVVGIVLAAGAGSRMGMPKALVHDDDGGWLTRSIATLTWAGCAPVIVVLGARAVEATALITDDPGVLDVVRTVVAPAWRSGLSASLRAGLAAAEGTDATAAVITLVDLPSLTRESVMRMIGSAPTRGDLRQALYDGSPGHPVVVGRDHWAALAATLSGDAGARGYLVEHGAEAVDCSDLGGGEDVDRSSISAEPAPGPPRPDPRIRP